MAGRVTGYSSAQVALHWVVVVLVAFQFLAHDGIETSWRAFGRGAPAPDAVAVLTYMHIAAGMLVFILVVARLYLRLTRGAPRPPANEPRLLQISAEGVHVSIYILLLLLPLSGLVAWFAGIEAAGEVHELLKNLLLLVIVLHVCGALFQHFAMRSDVLIRMFRPQKS